MDILESHWFFSMVEKRGASPRDRLLAVFLVVGDWMSAPGIRSQFSVNAIAAIPATPGYRFLTEFLARQALSAKASNPAVLSTQLGLLLIGAIAEQLRHPELQIMSDATEAARVLINQACASRPNRKWLYGGSIAATLVLSLATWGVVQHQSASSPMMSAYQPVALHGDSDAQRQLSPDEIEAVLALHEQIVSGVCRPPHMAMLPPGQTSAYMNVIEFRKPDDPIADRASIRAFMSWFNSIHATECYPPHTNDHINTVWVRRGSN